MVEKAKGAPHQAYGKSIEDLHLVEYAVAAAKKLKAAHSSIVFTSGRRDVTAQARAMAGNLLKNRQWIKQTYRLTAESRALQTWVDDHPAAKTKAAIAAGLESVMKSWSDAQKRNLSRHFSGQAFDVAPVAGAAGAKIKKTIRALPNLRRFLDKEGGVIIWHADFEKPRASRR
jgi:hypothetical protein